MSPDDSHAAWVSNKVGQYKVWLYDTATKKVKKIAKGEKKIDRIIDTSYPVLAWHPTSGALTWTAERKGELYLNTYTLDDRKTVRKPVFMLDKVLSMEYSADGRNMVFSGVREGRTDLYLYYVIGNRQEQLTDDQYDDLDPAFADQDRSIIFSSDRPDDTLRANGAPSWFDPSKDIFRLDLATRSPVLARLTTTPGTDEREPAMSDSTAYTWLSDADHVQDRWVAHYDSAVSAVDTIIHYRHFTVAQKVTDYRRGILEQDVAAGSGRFTELTFRDGKYHFRVGNTGDLHLAGDGGTGSGKDEVASSRPAARPITNDMGPVVKVDLPPPDSAAIDVAHYRFSDEGPAPPPGTQAATTKPDVPTIGLPAVPPDTSMVTNLHFPEQRNYTVNFSTDEVLTQLDNSYDSQFYQPLIGPGSLNPGLSGLTRMAASDLFEDYKITGGFRLALDLNNNGYMLRYANLRKRLDKELVFQRQATQGLSTNGVVKLHSHMLTYKVSYPFSELASVRGAITYRNDRYVTQSIDQFSLVDRNSSDQTVSARLEYVYDSSRPH
jgi:hypothetical protein